MTAIAIILAMSFGVVAPKMIIDRFAGGSTPSPSRDLPVSMNPTPSRALPVGPVPTAQALQEIGHPKKAPTQMAYVERSADNEP
jgi:hypothetical protein